MNDDDYGPFCEVWVAVMGQYGAKAPSNMQLEIAFEALREFPLPDVRRALSAHVRDPDTGQFQPKPADVVRTLKGTGSDRAWEAWRKVEKSLRQVGQYQSVCFDDPLIHVIVEEMGGWPALCRTNEEEELPFRRQEFVKRYAGLQRRGVEQYPKKLVGVEETENRAHGFLKHIPDTILIGDQSKARLVLEQGADGPRLEYSNAPRTLGQTAQAVLPKEAE